MDEDLDSFLYPHYKLHFPGLDYLLSLILCQLFFAFDVVQIHYQYRLEKPLVIVMYRFETEEGLQLLFLYILDLEFVYVHRLLVCYNLLSFLCLFLSLVELFLQVELDV